MSAIIPDTFNAFSPAQSGRVESLGRYGVGVFRLPTDPLFYASLTLQNIVVGSAYRVTENSTGLLLASGVASSTYEVIAGIPAYSNPMLVHVAVRKGTTAPKYIPLDAYGNISKSGGTIYISQVPDLIA
jgi:hypothetical protein